MGMPIKPVHYIELSVLELGNVESTNHDQFDKVLNSDKSRFVPSCTVLGEVLASEYEHIDPDVDAVLLQASQ